MAETHVIYDIGEEIILRLKEIIEKLNRIIAGKDEKEYPIALSCGNRTF